MLAPYWKSLCYEHVIFLFDSNSIAFGLQFLKKYTFLHLFKPKAKIADHFPTCVTSNGIGVAIYFQIHNYERILT